MINQKNNPVSWALLITELEEAQEHLGSLVDKMANVGAVEEEEYAVDLGHIYAHLNRAWHSRSQDGEISDEQWPVFSNFPNDLKPVG